jgi:hypothetical protein
MLNRLDMGMVPMLCKAAPHHGTSSQSDAGRLKWSG